MKGNHWKRLKLNKSSSCQRKKEAEVEDKHHPDYILIKSIHMDVLIKKPQLGANAKGCSENGSNQK